MVGGGHNAHIHADLFASAQAVIWHAVQHAQQLHLNLQVEIADFIQEKRAFVGHFKESGFWASAPLKAPFSYPKSSLSTRCSGIAAQFTSIKGPLQRNE